MSARENKNFHSQRPKAAESLRSSLSMDRKTSSLSTCRIKFCPDPFLVRGQSSQYGHNSELQEFETKTVYI